MKGLVHTSDGWQYHSDKRIYSLYEGIDIQSLSGLRSDLLFIMDDLDNNRDVEFVGYLWGADFIRDPNCRKEWESKIAEMVEWYEGAQKFPNGIARLEHTRKIVEAYLITNESVMHEEEEDIKEVEEIKKDLEYLTRLISKAKEIRG